MEKWTTAIAGIVILWLVLLVMSLITYGVWRLVT